MPIHSYGYMPTPEDAAARQRDFDTFTQALDRILANEELILGCPDYFFTPLSFAYCSWPYVGGSGPLCIGYLLLGWRDGLFVEHCPDCNKPALVTSFGGSPLSGSNSWSGYCRECKKRVVGQDSQHKPFSLRIEYVSKLRKTYPEVEIFKEKYEGKEFSWGGDGTKPAIKERTVTRNLHNPVSLDELLRDKLPL